MKSDNALCGHQMIDFTVETVIKVMLPLLKK